MAKGTQEVVQTQTQLPAHLQQYVGHNTGMDQIGQDDIATPRLILLQGLSPQLEEDQSLRAGQFFHSGAEEGLPSEIEVIPLHVAKSYTLWRPRPEGGILARSRDGILWDRTGRWDDVKILKGTKTVTWTIRTENVDKSRLAEWGTYDPDNPDSPPAATLSYNMPVLVVGHENLGPVVLSMQRSQIKVAKKLMGRLKLQTIPICGLTMPLSSWKDSGPEGPFFNIRFGKFGYVQDEKVFNSAKELFDMFAEKGVNVKDEEQPDEPTAGEPKADATEF